MPKLKELVKNGNLLTGGHRACAGCAGSIIIRQALMVAGPDTVATINTGCMEVVTTINPYTAWNIPLLHVAFENAAAAISGIESCYKSFKKKGKIKKEINFIAFGGDGGTYDIGLQALSGALERGHRFLYICYDNEAYMNTGIQRSSATPYGSHTTTSPAGNVIPGKRENRKDLTEIAAAHDIPYVAQASPGYWNDFMKKVEKALACGGPSFINVISPCPLGWRYSPEKTIDIAKLAVQTKFWPLYEVENGKHRITYKPREEVDIEEFLKAQGRFAHLFKPENRHIIDEIREEINRKWESLERLSST
ncbi:pyruvate ferredoxin oxidoreductase [candidate division WOR-3 bacterium JGI_Cruoil_03_44_89]|uniref:Pyruvate ferredoxin oxidoreductase n=1 Tax=candidate division WOR-3 bacterium JGI_Cruoil_03_44_89 TaxID=1973748 RepID=A0A235BQC0_UNCW3|nr:MAG: pyruvate ferredoxin oxidoreductase [candidate division WOR-3 bacterium JGI_Cruoil_03_44_89]